MINCFADTDTSSCITKREIRIHTFFLEMRAKFVDLKRTNLRLVYILEFADGS